jgi:hypothetical protein
MFGHALRYSIRMSDEAGSPAPVSTGINPALWGLLLVLPSTLFWAAIILSLIPGWSRLADFALLPVKRFDIYFVVGVLMLLPLAGSLLGAWGWKRGRALSVIVVILGLAAVCINLLMQSEGNPAH